MVEAKKPYIVSIHFPGGSAWEAIDGYVYTVSLTDQEYKELYEKYYGTYSENVNFVITPIEEILDFTKIKEKIDKAIAKDEE